MSINRLPSSPYLEMVVSHIREQILLLESVLETIERTHNYDGDYISESIKTAEAELRRLRRLIDQ